MVKFLQELFRWLATLPVPAKFLISAAVCLIAGAILVLVWMPGKTSSGYDGEGGYPVPDPSPNTSPQPPPPSPSVVPTPTPESSPKPLWPQAKTLEALKRLLDRTSVTNRRILMELLDSGRNGVYVSVDTDDRNSLEHTLSLSRNDILARGAKWEELHLIEILDLTDKNYRLHDDVWNAVGPNGGPLLRTLFK
jgi:hypothetical protein